MAEGVQSGICSGSGEEAAAAAAEDHSIVCRPIQTGMSGIQMVINSLKHGTPEIRDLLMNECDVIYECKVCRSLHRSLINFIAHKRSYCLQHVCESMQLFSEMNIENEEIVMVIPEMPEEKEPEDEDKNLVLEKEENVVEEVKKDEVIQMEIEKSTARIFKHHDRKSIRRVGLTNGVSSDVKEESPSEKFYSNCMKHLENRKSCRVESRLELRPVEGNPNAVFQTTNSSDSLRVVRAANLNAVKVPLKSVEMKRKSSCVKCGKRFKSTRKMFVHLQSVHATIRTYFPCPCCPTVFGQIWSCFRHLMKVHKKTKLQVDKLRDKIKKRAFQKATELLPPPPLVVPPPAVKIKEEPKLEVAVFQCNICSKVFSQKPSLDGHRSSCLTKQRAAAAAALLKVRRESAATEELTKESNEVIRSERPRRIVKKKMLDQDFVNSSYINIRTNSVNPPKKIDQQQQQQSNNSMTSMVAPEKILLKLNSIIDCRKKQCLKCRQTFVTLSNARRHAAGHIGYNRFGCKKCHFQAYGRSQIRCHILKLHVNEKVRVKESYIDSLIENVQVEEDKDDDDDDDGGGEEESKDEEAARKSLEEAGNTGTEAQSQFESYSLLQAKVEIKTEPKSPCREEIAPESEESEKKMEEKVRSKQQVVKCSKVSEAGSEPIYVFEFEEEQSCDKNYLVGEDHNYFSSSTANVAATTNGVLTQLEQEQELLEAVGSITQK